MDKLSKHFQVGKKTTRRNLMKKIRKLLCLVLVVAILAIPMFVMSPAYAQKTLNLKAVWTPNAEPDMAGYYFYDRTNTANILGWLVGGIWGVYETTQLLLPLSPTQLLFTSSVPDTPTTGTLKFALKAVDTNSNMSPWCPDVSYAYNVDSTPPVAPTGLVISKQ